VGALLGAQALVFLKVLDCHDSQRQQNLGTDKKGNTSYNYIVQGSISGSVRAVSLTTGQVLAAQRFEGSGQAENFAAYPDPAIPREAAEKSAAFAVHKLLLPWKETKRIVFFNDAQCDLKVASNLLKGEDLDGALKQSEINLTNCPGVAQVKPSTIAHAYYNLGVLQFMKDDFDTALTNLHEALKRDGSSIYAEVIADCKRAKELSVAVNEYQKELQAQSSDDDNSKPASKPAKVGRARTEDVKKPAPATSSSPSVADRLSNLDDLLKKKLITPEEYNLKRARILDSI
jgi:tetratricopeptide (TPR) repeat protein